MKRYLSFAVLIALGACGGSVCDCLSPGIFIIAEGVNVISMALSGSGCEDATIRSTVPVPYDAAISSTMPLPSIPTAVASHTGFEPGGLDYSLMPSHAGDCTVGIGLDSGVMLERTVTFTYQEGECCAGYYTHDRSWRLRDWALDASVD